MREVVLRCYGPLNDFLPRERRQVAFTIRCNGRRSVKDAIESAGVPHPEVDVIIRNGEPVPFDAILADQDRIAVFPRLWAIDVFPVHHMRPRPPAPLRFAPDDHLGALTKQLRLLGFDSARPAGVDDKKLVALAAQDHRIVLTRDRELLKRRGVTHGYFVRNTQPLRQVIEVRSVPKAVIEGLLPPRTPEQYDECWICDTCGQRYWRGWHWARLQELVARARSGDRVA